MLEYRSAGGFVAEEGDCRSPRVTRRVHKAHRSWRIIALPQLARRHGRRLVFGVFALVSTAVSIAVIAVVADVARAPIVFPSLGPTAFLIFDQPRRGAASPRNVLLGHLIGILCGLGALAVTGTYGRGPSLSGGLPAQRVAAAAIALGVTSGAMALLQLPHPPAAATALIVSLGFLTHLADALTFYAGVIALVGQGFVIDRLSGLRYPLWSAESRHSRHHRRAPPSDGLGGRPA
jgi:CBS-domain-containing membrane protein